MDGIMNMTQQIREIVRRELQRFGLLVRRGLLGGGVSSSYYAKIQGAGDDDFEDVETWQHFGFASRPPVSGEVLMVLPFGRGEGAIVCAETDRAHRPSIAANEVSVYGYKSGSVQAVITMRAHGDIDLVPGTSQVVRVGDSSGCEFALLGESFESKLSALNTAIVALGAAAGPDAAVINGIKAALTSFSSSSSALLASVAKVK
jgi:hypothetical protein